MEQKEYKPVPDVECLKYHGTPEKPDIKIFVSHRIDLDSETIDNPLYIPVRCGAVYDERENVTMLGDDTGDNISEKRMSFCELTVIYWMWKNIRADYYGLSHYRRYLSFSDKKYPGAWQEQGFLDSMTGANLKKAGLLDDKRIRKNIETCDMVIPMEFPVKEVSTPHGTGYRNAYDYVTRAWEGLFIYKEDIDNMLKIIDMSFPEYKNSAREFMKGATFRGFNMFILKKELFYSLCEFEFGVLEKLNPMIDYKYASDSRKRAPGYLGEVLYSIWCYHQMKKRTLKIGERQIIFFQDTSREVPPPKSEEDGIVTVCYQTTYEEIALTGVSLQSVVDHISPSKKYRFIFLLKNMPENRFFVTEQKRQKDNLIAITAGHRNVEMVFYDPKEGLGPIDAREFDAPSLESECYSILIPWILKNVDKVVFLTPYAILKTDIAGLFETRFERGAILAVKDLLAIGNVNGYDHNICRHLKRYVKMKDHHKYVDSTVMVMDLERIRKNYDVERIYEILERRERDYFFGTNDIFNMIYEDDVDILPFKWNMMNCSTPQLLQCVDFVESDVAKEFNCVSAPLLINFKNFPKPWQNINSDHSFDFWFVARKTPFYEQILTYQFAESSIAIQDSKYRRDLYALQTEARQVYNKLCPPNSGRQKVVDSIFPKNSRRREMLKRLVRALCGSRKQRTDNEAKLFDNIQVRKTEETLRKKE